MLRHAETAALSDGASKSGGISSGKQVARRDLMLSAALEELTGRIIGCAIAVHKETGPGLLESIYKTCLVLELRARGLLVETERPLPVVYRGVRVDSHFRHDIVVEDLVVVEVKAVASVAAVHHAQVITYLKLSGCPVGLLINFNVPVLTNGVRRVVRPDMYQK